MVKMRTEAVAEWHTAAAAARVSGLSVDMVNYLCRSRIVTPSGSSVRGRGKARRYLFTDILLLRIIQKLLAQGISVLRLKRALIALQKQAGTNELLRKRYAGTDGVNLYFGSGEILEQLGTGQMAFAFIVELGAVRREVTQRITAKRSA